MRYRELGFSGIIVTAEWVAKAEDDYDID